MHKVWAQVVDSLRKTLVQPADYIHTASKQQHGLGINQQVISRFYAVHTPAYSHASLAINRCGNQLIHAIHRPNNMSNKGNIL
jgi:hypothetical protein